MEQELEKELGFLADNSEVVYIAGLAKIFGKTESSVREGLRRGVPWLPRSFKIAGQHAWLKVDVYAFLRAMAEGVVEDRQERASKKKPGRKRCIPPVFQA